MLTLPFTLRLVHGYRKPLLLIIYFNPENFHSCTVHFDSSSLLLIQPVHNNFASKH